MSINFAFIPTSPLIFTCSAPGRLAFLQQKVSIGGITSCYYNVEQESLQDIMNDLIQLANIRVDLKRNPTNASFLTFSNRVFSQKPDVSNIDARVLGSDVDPYGTLTERANISGLTHAEDNEVSYLRYTRAGFLYAIIFVTACH